MLDGAPDHVSRGLQLMHLGGFGSTEASVILKTSRFKLHRDTQSYVRQTREASLLTDARAVDTAA
jgi:hypothetical protein